MADKPTYGELEQRVRDLEKKETVRKQIENELRISKQLLRDVMDIAPVFICAKNLDGRFILVNKKLTDFYGTTVEDMTGVLHADICEDEAELQGMLAADRKVIFSGKPEYIPEETMENPHGSISVLETYKIPFTAYEQPAVLIVSTDITERKKAEGALRESTERLSILFEQASDAIYVSQLDGRLINVNEQASRSTGYTEEELLNLGFKDVDADMKTLEALQKVFHRLSPRHPITVESRHCRKDGSTFPVEITMALLRTPGGPHVLGIARDITERKRMEAQLQQAQKMEAIGTLAGGIAHDFNNLLMSIQGQTDIMKMNKDSSDPDFGHLCGIEELVGSAAGLTRQLLDFARGGKYEVRLTNLNEFIKKENRMFGRTKKEITVRGKYEETLWAVEVDRGQFEQVLLNLYVNAWQAMPGGGEIRVETQNITLDAYYTQPHNLKPGRYVKITVCDTGIGMDKATRERIFDPFFTTKEMGRGTGLGLASAYGIIKNHGGFIHVSSEMGHGTAFSIYLPASAKKVMGEKERAGDIIRGSETVLFVDDEEIVVDVTRELLERLGYNVLIAGSGKEAIEIYEGHKESIDIVVLDMIMPDMGGDRTYDGLKKLNPRVKVLLSSGYSIDGQAAEILERGCNGFIQKPFKMRELSRKLRGILDERNYQG